MPVKKPVEEVSSDASVYYEKSFTKNLGNYESAKVVVGITLPINPTKDTLNSLKVTLEKADEIVSDELDTQLKALEDI